MSSAARFEGRTTKAAVLRQIGGPFEIEELEVAEPGAGEVMVRVGASGVCHSDLHILNGDWSGEQLPIVLGHEGAGTVAAVGEGVKKVVPGDRVALSWLPSCGRCDQCVCGRPQLCLAAPGSVYENLMPDRTSRLRNGDESIFSMLTVGSFSEYTVVPESGAVPIGTSVPLDRAAVVGCAVATGFGAAVNTAKVRPGARVAVIGCGGVGVSIIQGCAAQSANPIIAVDTSQAKLGTAQEFGATHLVDARALDAVDAVLEMTAGRGVDFAFEAIGLRQTTEQALGMLGNGGAAVLVGMPPDGTTAEISPMRIASSEHRILGCNYGSCNPPIDFPRILDLYADGRLNLDSMISRRFRLEEIDAAFEALAGGEVVRSVVIHGDEASGSDDSGGHVVRG